MYSASMMCSSGDPLIPAPFSADHLSRIAAKREDIKQTNYHNLEFFPTSNLNFCTLIIIMSTKVLLTIDLGNTNAFSSVIFPFQK